METTPRIAYKTAITLLLVLLISLVLSACSGTQQIDSVVEVDSATTESLTTAAVPAETPTATPSPTVTSTATITPSPTPSPTPFPEPNDAEYNMLTCEALGGVQGFVNFDAPTEGAAAGLEAVIEPAFYAYYEGSDDLLHHVWSHFYQQVGDAPKDDTGGWIPFGVLGNHNYDICLKKGASAADAVQAKLIIPNVQSQEAIDGACKNPNANGFSGQQQATAIYVSEDGTLATDFLAEIELSDCYGFISGAQTPEENAIAHLINQYARPVFELEPENGVSEEAVLQAQSYQIFTKDKDIYSNFPFRFMTSPGGDAFFVECIDNNYGEGIATNYPELCSLIDSPEQAPFVEKDRKVRGLPDPSYSDPPNIDFACYPSPPGLNCEYPFNAINVFPGYVTRVQPDQVKVTYEASDGTFEVYYGHIVPTVNVGDVLEVGDVIGHTFPRDLGRHYLSIAMTGEESRLTPTFYDPMDPRFGLLYVSRIPYGKTWNP